VSCSFSFTGTEDHVYCFACGVGLRMWENTDYPWIEHCRWSPTCPYSRQKVGVDFIASVQAAFGHGDDV